MPTATSRPCSNAWPARALQRFVQDTVAPLTHRVGEAWEDGSFEVFEEHLFTELTKRLLRQAIAALPGGAVAARASC
jgi:MerR family transcriptional regulator, light-induced transcriptional regulator